VDLCRHFTPLRWIVPFRDWEVFAAILVNDRGSGVAYGSDLTAHEVKSATFGGSFEYQYHKNTGRQKFEHDQTVEHVFVVYDDSYRSVAVYTLTAAQFGTFAAGWRANLEASYGVGSTQQRFRRSIAFGDVTRSGALGARVADTGRRAGVPRSDVGALRRVLPPSRLCRPFRARALP